MIWVSIIYDRKLFIVVYYVFLDLSGGFLVPFMTRPRLVMIGARNSTITTMSLFTCIGKEIYIFVCVCAER